MLIRIAELLVAHICVSEDADKYSVCVYGCELLLYALLSTTGLFLIGVLLNFPLETIIIITVFYLCQSNGGGYHANTHTQCFITMVCGLFIALIALCIPKVSSLLPFTASVAAVVLLIHPLHLHHNKQYLSASASHLARRSRIVTVCVIVVLLLLGVAKLSLFYAGCIALVLSAISRWYAIWTA